MHGGGRNGDVRYGGDDPGNQVKHLGVLMSVIAEGEPQVHDEGVEPESLYTKQRNKCAYSIV